MTIGLQCKNILDVNQFESQCFLCLYRQFLLVDLRCHGDSASIKKRGHHTVASAALDVLKLVCIFNTLHISCLYSEHAIEWGRGLYEFHATLSWWNSKPWFYEVNT